MRTKLCCRVNPYIKKCIHCDQPICETCHRSKPFVRGPHYDEPNDCNGGTYFKNIQRMMYGKTRYGKEKC